MAKLNTAVAAALCTDVLDALEPAEQASAIQLLAVRYLGEKTQVCGWCHATYRTPDEASACARRCRSRADMTPTTDLPAAGEPTEYCEGCCGYRSIDHVHRGPDPSGERY